jgi:AraC-like DNA-binding protein
MPEIHHSSEAGEFEDGMLSLSRAHRFSSTRDWRKTEVSTLQNGHHCEGANVNTKLRHIEETPNYAREAHWSVTKLAKIYNVSPRTLERHFIETIGKSPKVWLTELRQRQAIELVRRGFSIKEVSLRLGYSHPQHFSRVFKEYWGCRPSDSASLKLENHAPCRVSV